MLATSEQVLDFDSVLDLCQVNKNPAVLALVGTTLASKLDLFHQQLSTIATFAPNYDSKIGVKANGYRSFIKIAAKLLEILTRILEKANHSGDQSQWSRNYQHWVKCLDMLITLNSFLLDLHEVHHQDSDKLFPDKPDLRDYS